MPTNAERLRAAAQMPAPSENRRPSKPGGMEFARLSDYPAETAMVLTIISQWNMNEHGFFGILARLLRSSKPAHARALLSKVVSSKAKLDVLCAVGKVELKDAPALLKKFQGAMKQLGLGLHIRNRYAHGIYVVNKKGELCILHREFDIPPSSKHMTVLHSRVLIKEAQACSAAFDQLVDLYRKLSKTP